MSLNARLVNRLRLKHWTLLSALGDVATLNQAAAQINVAQPSATKMLSDIEQAFGFPLFERHARGMRPTPLGSEVVAYARQTQAGLERFLEDLDVKRALSLADSLCRGHAGRGRRTASADHAEPHSACPLYPTTRF